MLDGGLSDRRTVK